MLALRRAGYSAEGLECNPVLLETSNRIFDQLGRRAAFRFARPTRPRPTHLSMAESLLAGGYTATFQRVSAGWLFSGRSRNCGGEFACLAVLLRPKRESAL